MRPEEKGNYPLQLQALWSTLVTCLRDMLIYWGHQCCVSHQPLSDWISGPLHELEPTPDKAQVAENLRLCTPWAQGERKELSSDKRGQQHMTVNGILLPSCSCLFRSKRALVIINDHLGY